MVSTAALISFKKVRRGAAALEVILIRLLLSWPAAPLMPPLKASVGIL